MTIVALAYGGLLEGAVLIETVFSWPGFGQYMTNNMLIGDMNAVMTCVLLVGVIFITLNLHLGPALQGLRSEDAMTAVTMPSIRPAARSLRRPALGRQLRRHRRCGTWRATRRRASGSW